MRIIFGRSSPTNQDRHGMKNRRCRFDWVLRFKGSGIVLWRPLSALDSIDQAQVYDGMKSMN